MSKAKKLYEKHLKICKGEGYRSDKQMVVIRKEAALAAIEEALEEKSPFVPNLPMPVQPIVDWIGSKRARTYGDICPCNPTNGGSGVCGCILGNEPLEENDEVNPIQPYYQHQITCESGIITKSEFVKVDESQ